MKKKVLLGEPGGEAVGGAALPGARPGRLLQTGGLAEEPRGGFC